MTDPFEHDDAAYVLGALDEPDRVAFEAHLETCPACQERVADARATTQLLDGLPADAFDEPVPPPDTLLPGLLRKARRERSRRRAFTAAIGGLAAACAIALAVVLWPAGGSSSPPAHSFAAVRPNPITATARLLSREWGTEIDLRCRYAPGVDAYQPYDLIVKDKDGHSHAAGSWRLEPDKTITFTGGTSVPLDEISSVQITTADGVPLLEMDA
ncbi:MAG TPA: zf-HC2 domain-containing protein [Jatrophihabitans sp.]|nr:zf-HC2 domain-containing protein [Jatrophihabitans sp.]